jgi:hypothetical protein
MFLRDPTNNAVKHFVREQHAKVIYEGLKNMATGLDGEPDVVMGAKNGFVAVGDCVLFSTEKWWSVMEPLCRECDFADFTVTKHVVEAIVNKVLPREHLPTEEYWPAVLRDVRHRLREPLRADGLTASRQADQAATDQLLAADSA